MSENLTRPVTAPAPASKHAHTYTDDRFSYRLNVYNPSLLIQSRSSNRSLTENKKVRVAD